MGNTCKPMAVLFQGMTKFTTNKKNKNKNKKRWQEYTEELYKTDLNDLDNHDDVIIHLEPDTLEYEVKWALGSITKKRKKKTKQTALIVADFCLKQ